MALFDRDELNTSNALDAGKAAPKSRSTDVVGNEVRPPEGGFGYEKNKKVAKDKPIRCEGANKCNAHAVVGVENELGRKHLCQKHWTKAGKPEFFPIYPTDKEENANLRADRAEGVAQGRVRDADLTYKVTGIHTPVRGPGRPVTAGEKVSLREEIPSTINLYGRSEESEDSPESQYFRTTTGSRESLLQGGRKEFEQLQDAATALIKTLDHSSVNGGRNNTPDHDAKLSVAHTSLLHALNSTGNDTSNAAAIQDAYHAKATSLGMTNPIERNKYFAHAMALESKKRKSSVVPKRSDLPGALSDYRINMGDDTDRFSEVESMLGDTGTDIAKNRGLSTPE